MVLSRGFRRCVRALRIAWLIPISGCGRIETSDRRSATSPEPPEPTKTAAAGADVGSDEPAIVATSVYIGDETSLALLSDGRLATWGRNGSGELAREGNSDLSIDQLDFEFVAVSAGSHTCFLDARGAIRCSGYNANFQLGDGTSQSRARPALVTVISEPALLVAAGGARTCAYTTDTVLQCWGGSYIKQELLRFSAGIAYVDAAVGGNHLCAVDATGMVACFGGYTIEETHVVAAAGPVAGLSGAVQVVAGFSHSCARTEQGNVWCWGEHGRGQLGVASPPEICASVKCTPQPTAVELPNGVRAAKIAAGNDATVVITTEGRLFGWGGLELDGTCKNHPVCSRIPRRLSAFDDVVDAGIGDEHLCLLRRDGSVWCWGQNTYGQVTSGNADFFDGPVRVLPP